MEAVLDAWLWNQFVCPASPDEKLVRPVRPEAATSPVEPIASNVVGAPLNAVRVTTVNAVPANKADSAALETTLRDVGVAVKTVTAVEVLPEYPEAAAKADELSTLAAVGAAENAVSEDEELAV